MELPKESVGVEPLGTTKVSDAVKSLLPNAGSWCQRRFASDKSNQVVAIANEQAVKFCFVGAVRRAIHKELITADEATAYLLERAAMIMADDKLKLLIKSDYDTERYSNPSSTAAVKLSAAESIIMWVNDNPETAFELIQPLL